MNKTFKYRLYPNKKQEILLRKTFGCVRYFWNKQVEIFNSYDKELNPRPVYQNSTIIRNSIVWMKEVSAVALQQKEIDFKEFKKQHFNSNRKSVVRNPKYKNKNSKQSFRVNNQTSRVESDKILITKIGKIKYVKDRDLPINYKLINITVSMDKCGDFYASILVETEIEKLPKTNKSVGVDVGIKSFATLSNGEVIPSNRFFRDSQAELRKAQRRFAKKVKGSSRWKKSKKKVAKIYRKAARQREYFLQTLTTRLVKEFDVISIEDLNVAGMKKNRRLSKSISDASFSMFFNMLKYKCEWYGKELVKVNRWFPSSKQCYCCGNVKKVLTLNERIYKCQACGFEMDRDLNAALNIEALGINSAIRS